MEIYWFNKDQSGSTGITREPPFLFRVFFSVREKLLLFQEQLREGKTSFLLDIGCGSGLSGALLEERGHYWVGCDISKDMLQVCNLSCMKQTIRKDIKTFYIFHFSFWKWRLPKKETPILGIWSIMTWVWDFPLGNGLSMVLSLYLPCNGYVILPALSKIPDSG